VTALELRAAHAELPAPAQQFAYADSAAAATAAKEGVPRTGIALDFGGGVSTPSWRWDAERGEYLRSQGGAADLDSSGTQLGATNLIVLRVRVDASPGVPKTELIGSGEAVISSRGGTLRATWSKPSATSPIRLVDESGIVVRLAPGTSWIELLPDDGAATFAE
jgi:hypothetical protein